MLRLQAGMQWNHLERHIRFPNPCFINVAPIGPLPALPPRQYRFYLFALIDVWITMKGRDWGTLWGFKVSIASRVAGASS